MFHASNLARLSAAVLGLVGALCASSSVHAAPVVFETPPFQGSTADPNDGVRTVFGGNERFLPSFDVKNDQFVFDATAFGLAGPLRFASSTAAGLASTGANVIVLQDTDNDGNPATAFNAGSAANLIAAALDTDGAGFFIYSNSVLGVNRLVYSSNLNANTGDLSILARIVSPSGAGAIAALPTFGAGNFAVSAVPEPGSLGLLAAGLGVLAWRRRATARA